MLRSIGAAIDGDVLVLGGAEYVRAPRLPIDAPPPAFATAKAGASARLATTKPVKMRDARMKFIPFVRVIYGSIKSE